MVGHLVQYVAGGNHPKAPGNLLLPTKVANPFIFPGLIFLSCLHTSIFTFCVIKYFNSSIQIHFISCSFSMKILEVQINICTAKVMFVFTAT